MAIIPDLPKKIKWHYTKKFSHVFKQIGLCGLSGSTLTQPIFVRVKFDPHFMRVWFYWSNTGQVSRSGQVLPPLKIIKKPKII